jgi:hypothetical protein
MTIVAKLKLNSVALARKWTISTERPPLSAKLVPTFTARRCSVYITMDPYCRNLGFLDRGYCCSKYKAHLSKLLVPLGIPC